MRHSSLPIYVLNVACVGNTPNHRVPDRHPLQLSSLCTMSITISLLANYKPDKYGVPSLRAVAHIITSDPGIYFEDHYGCMAHSGIWTGPLWPVVGRSPPLGEQRLPYTCCNKKIEDFNLVASRTALLRFLMLSSWPNLEVFIDTVSCATHREDKEKTAFLRSH